MSKKFLVPIDMSTLEVQNFLVHNLTSAPTGIEGRLYYNTTDHYLYYYNGTSWIKIQPLSDVITGVSDVTIDDTTIVTNGVAKIPTASGSAKGLMTSSDYTKLSGIATGAEVNQNAFSNVTVKATSSASTTTTIAADAKTDTLGLEAGANVTLTADATNDKITIAATDTVTTVTVTGSGNAITDITASSGALTATKGTTFLTEHQTIKQDGVTGATVNRFGTCSTAAGTAGKEVSITTGTFSLETGAKVTVKFSNANTANSPTLKVGTTDAKNIFHKGSQITTGGNKALLAGTCEFVYDGTQYHLIGNYIDTDTKNTAGSTDSSSKLFLIGATSQAASPQTYSQDTAYVGTDGHLYSNSQKVLNAADKGAASGVVPLDSSSKIDNSYLNLDTTVTSDASNAVTSSAVYTYVNNQIAAADAMIYKGTLGTGGTITTVPTNGYKTGWTYKVITAATYAGIACEVGDMLIALNDGPNSGSSVINADWTVVQTNIDGAVTGPATSTANNIATFSDATGKVIKDSGYTIATSVPSGAVFTDTKVSTAEVSSMGFYYPIVGGYGTTPSTKYYDTAGFTYEVSTSSSRSFAQLTLGNSTADASGGRTGSLSIYGKDTYRVKLETVSNVTTDQTLKLPNKTGTLATDDVVTQSTNGLMSAADKVTLDNLSAASAGALVSGTLTIAANSTSVSAAAIADKLVTYQAYQDNQAVVVDYGLVNNVMSFSVATAAASDITIKYIKTV